jgi:hypothetical protein
MRQLYDVCDTVIEFIIESPLFRHPKTHREPPGACSGVWQSQEKAHKGPSYLYGLAIKAGIMPSHIGNDEGLLHELLTPHEIFLRV